jgi:hypothetical protein
MNYTFSNNSTSADNSTNVKFEDEYAVYLGKVVSVQTTYRQKPIKGKLITLSRDSIELERLDKNITKIKRIAILEIKAARVRVV